VSTLPRALLEPRANRMLVMKALRQITSMGRATAVPVPGVAAFRSNQRCSASDMNKLKRLWN